MGLRPSKFSPQPPEGTLRRQICSPGSSPPIPVSSQVSGPPRRASWPRTARREHSHPPARRLWTSRRSAAAPTPSMSAQPVGGSVNSRRSWSPSWAMYAMPPTSGPATGTPARPLCSLSTRSPTSRPSPISRPWSAKARARGSWCWPACRTSPRPASGGGRRPTAFSRSSAPRWSCAASPTRPRCATSARWRETARWRPRPSADRWTAGAVSAPRRQWGAPAWPGSRWMRWHTARPVAPWSSARTRRCTRWRSRPRTSARPGVSSSPGAPTRPAGPRRTGPLSQRPRPRSTVAGSRHPSLARAEATARSVRMWSARRDAGSAARFAGSPSGASACARPHLSR